MAKVRQQTVEIRQFLIEEAEAHPSDLVAFTAAHFQITRQAVNRHVNHLTEAQVLEASGQTNSRTYRLRPLSRIEKTISLKGLEEDVPWTYEFQPYLSNTSDNVQSVCNYAFTELLNNAIDHSESEFVTIELLYTAASVSFTIHDNGVGIFRKIKNVLKLNHERESVLELAKGKLTTDPDRHTGEGIFFTSRMVDLFYIMSGHLYFTHSRTNGDWLLEDESEESVSGTRVNFVVDTNSTMKPQDVFDLHSSDGDFGFSRTHVPVRLAQFGADRLVSRSQAKRIITRFERFKEIALDFKGVEFIGQAFADEIFRVFQSTHPDVKLVPINANDMVKGMISRSRSQSSQR